MAHMGFSREDFEVFAIPTFPERMQGIKERLRPKLTALGESLQPALTKLTKSDVFPHVAKHARRTVNPPPETWVAFGPSSRGYKKYGYFGLALSRGGVHTRLVVKDEAPDRPQMAKELIERADVLASVFAGHTIARYDRWNYLGIPDVSTPTADFWQEVAEALAKKTGGLDVGVGWPVHRALKLTDKQILAAFRALLPLYEITRA